MGRAIGVTRSWHGDTADTAMHCYPKLSDGGGGGIAAVSKGKSCTSGDKRRIRQMWSDVLTCWKVDEPPEEKPADVSAGIVVGGG